MGTNFYLHRIPTEEDIKKIHEAVDKLDFDDAKYQMKLADKEIHIGKRSCGWQFHFDIHRNMEWEDCEDGMEIPPEEFCLERVKEYIVEKIAEGWELKDEYGEVFTPEQFWEEEVGGSLYCKKGFHNHETYYKAHPSAWHYWIKNTEYTSKDGLRYDTRWFG